MRPPPALAFGLALALALQLAAGESTWAHPQAPLLTALVAEAHSAAEPHPEVRVKRQGEQPLDTLIDFMLAGPIPQIVSRGASAMPLPDFAFHINASLGKVLEVAGDFKASGGAVLDIKSLFRQGPAVLRRSSSGALLLDVSAGLRLLRLVYANYSASVNQMRAKGRIEVEASPASVAVQVALVPPCRAQLRRLQLARLGAVRVRVSGLPPPLAGLPALLEGLCQQPALRDAAAAFVLGHVAGLVAQQLQRISCNHTAPSPT